MKHIQILYHHEMGSHSIAPELQAEAAAMAAEGFLVGTSPQPEADIILYRGPTIWEESAYPRSRRLIQGWKEYRQTLFLSQYYPLIEELTIPTFFCQDLNADTEHAIGQRGWDSVMVKNDVSAIICQGQVKSFWPETAFPAMKALFAQMPQTGTYAIRKRIQLSLYEEDRYWILNHSPYHRSGIIPDIVREAVQRLRPIGSHYYVIDATPEIIIEVNPGESSDRYIENTPDVFAGWFRDAFLPTATT